MGDLADDLRTETERWQGKLDEGLEEIAATDSKQREFLSNVEAYRSDSDHFMEEGDLIRAFEAVVWAWAWLEIGKERGILGR